jgi:PAS domain S-box-containing protein
MEPDWSTYRSKIIGLGEESSRKSYYPELQDKIAELESAKNNLQTIINSISDCLILHDSKGLILSTNEQARKLYGITEESYGLLSIRQISAEQMNYDSLFKIWKEVLEGKNHIFEWLSKNIETGEEIPVQISLNATNWDGKELIVAVVRNFTERKKYEQELIEARKKAEESDRLKSAFLANMSHEIRTPLNGILGFAELLKDVDLNPLNTDHYIEMIEKSGGRLLNIINDLLDISKIESGQMYISLLKVDVDQLMNYLFNFFEPEANQRKISLIRFTPESTDQLIITTDQEKLTAILTNLIKNALKYCHKGYIEFGYQVNAGYIQFFVKDTGIGISSDKIHLIFERFMRENMEIAMKYEGAGLGLAISKAYVEMLGGKIWVESEKDKGSCFYFTLPNNS